MLCVLHTCVFVLSRDVFLCAISAGLLPHVPATDTPVASERGPGGYASQGPIHLDTRIYVHVYICIDQPHINMHIAREVDVPGSPIGMRIRRNTSTGPPHRPINRESIDSLYVVYILKYSCMS